MTVTQPPKKALPTSRKPRTAPPSAAKGGPATYRAAAVLAVVDVTKLMRHAWYVHMDAGNSVADAPRTVEDAISVTLFALPDSCDLADYGLKLLSSSSSPEGSAPEGVAEAVAELEARYAGEKLDGVEPTDWDVAISAHYLHEGRVKVRARSKAEAERMGEGLIGDSPLRVGERIEGTELATATAIRAVGRAA